MSAHRHLFDGLQAPFAMTDPGSGGTITVDRDRAVCKVVTAAAEARTLDQPTKAGLMCTVELQTDGGDLTLTVTGGYNQAASTSITFGDVGDWVLFHSVDAGGTFTWRVLNHEGTNLVETGGGTYTTLAVTTLTGTTGIIGTVNATNSTITTGTITNATLGREQVTSSAVTAAGSAIGNAAATNYGMNVVTGANNATGVILPAAVANGRVEILQTVNNAFLLIYPQVNSAIGGLGVDNALNTGLANTAATGGTTQNTYFKFIATNTTQWYVDQ